MVEMQELEEDVHQEIEAEVAAVEPVPELVEMVEMADKLEQHLHQD